MVNAISNLCPIYIISLNFFLNFLVSDNWRLIMQQSAGLVLLCIIILTYTAHSCCSNSQTDYSYGYRCNLCTQWAHSFSELQGKGSRFIHQRREKRPRYGSLIVLFWCLETKESSVWFILSICGRAVQVPSDSWILIRLDMLSISSCLPC